MAERSQVEIDRDRVTVLLLINCLLIKKAYHIFVTILSNRQTFQQMLPQNRQSIMEQYNNINRRLQCNLGVLSYISDVYFNKVAAQQPNRIQFPVILLTPPEMPELRLLYKRLQDLYPDAIEFLKLKIQQMKQQGDPQAQPVQGGNIQSPSIALLPPNVQRSIQQQSQQMPMHQAQKMGQTPQQNLMQPPQQHQNFPQYSMTQTQTPPHYQSPQMNILQQSQRPGQALGGVPQKMQPPPQSQRQPQLQAQHAQSQANKQMDMQFTGGGITPQMIAKDPDMLVFGDPSGFMGDLKNPSSSMPMLSISPQQILLQQLPNNDMSMDFF